MDNFDETILGSIPPKKVKQLKEANWQLYQIDFEMPQKNYNSEFMMGK